jgi:hypothetical protein
MLGLALAISRVIHSAQALTDYLIYKQEKIGSRPRRAVGITKGGLDPEEVVEAFSWWRASRMPGVVQV